MIQAIIDDFAALSSRAKIAVFSRAIHMETIHVRSAHVERPEDAGYLYQSSEFVHRLSGFVMALAYEPGSAEKTLNYATKVLVDGVARHGPTYLTRLHEWIVEARTLS